MRFRTVVKITNRWSGLLGQKLLWVKVHAAVYSCDYVPK